MSGESDLGNPRVVVLGTGLAELASAYEFARFGVPVTVIDEVTETPVIPRGPQSDPHGALASWIADVARSLREDTQAEAEAVHVAPGVQWVRRAGRWVRIPDGSVYGIPPSPLSRQTIDALGSAGAFRAYLDRITPVLTIGKAQLVSELVGKRLGAPALDTLVDPLVRHLFGLGANDVEVSQLAPGLNEALTRAGSLSGAALAYSERLTHLAGGVVPNIGWDAFTDLLRRRLEAHGARWVTLDGPLETSLPETGESGDTDEARDTGDTVAAGGQVLVRSGSQRVQADVLIAPATHPAQARRTEITFVHSEAPDLPVPLDAGSLDKASLDAVHRDSVPLDSATMTEFFSALTGVATGWTRRTITLPGSECLTELRGPAGPPNEADIDATIEAAGFVASDVRELPITHARPFPATDLAASDELQLRDRHAAVIDTHVLSSERGLAAVVAHNIDRARVLRREILGLA